MPLLLALLISCPKPETAAPADAATPPATDPIAAAMLADLDPTADPCEDFYRFACGGRLARGDEAPTFVAQHYAMDVIAALVADAAAGRPAPAGADDDAWRELGALYRSCTEPGGDTSPAVDAAIAAVDAAADPAALARVWGQHVAGGLTMVLQVVPTSHEGRTALILRTNPAASNLLALLVRDQDVPEAARPPDPARTFVRAMLDGSGTGGSAPLSLAGATAVAPDVPWGALLTGAGLAPEDVRIESRLAAGLGVAFANADPAQIRSFLTWQASRMAPRRPTDPDACVADVVEAAPDLVARFYGAATTTADERAAAEAVIGTVRTAFLARVARSSWMDEATRDAVTARTEQLRWQIGHPGTVSLPERTHDDYASLRLAWRAHRWERLRAALGRPMPWPVETSLSWLVGAWYLDIAGTVVISDAFMQPPLFDPQRSAASTYGVFGTVAAHELLHAFGPDEVREAGMSARAERAVRGSAACVMDRHRAWADRLGVDVVDRSSWTVDEDLADIGGLNVAWDAWRLWRDVHGKESFTLPGYSEAQVFFISYAQMWCGLESPAWDTHADPHLRVDLAVANLPEFAESFHCPVGSPEAPLADDACAPVW